MMNYLTINQIVDVANEAIAKGEKIFEIEGCLSDTAIKELGYTYGFFLTERINAGSKLGPDYAIYNFDIDIPLRERKVSLLVIISDMPKLQYSPSAYVGNISIEARQILESIGFITAYSEEECLTVIAKRS